MKYLNKVKSIKAEMITALSELVEKSDMKTMVSRGIGGDKYIHIDFEKQHEGHYCVTSYKALMLDSHGNLELHQDVRCIAMYLPIDRLTILELATLTDKYTQGA